MMRRRTGQENFRYSQQHSLDSMASSSSNFLPSDPFQQTPPRVQLRPSDPETKVKKSDLLNNFNCNFRIRQSHFICLAPC